MKVFFRPGDPIFVRALLRGPSGTVETRLIVDTGAVSTMIGPKVLARAGLFSGSPADRVSVTTASGVIEVPRVQVESLECLGVERRDLAVTAHILPPSAPIDGLLGLDFLVGLRLTLDMKKGELIAEEA